MRIQTGPLIAIALALLTGALSASAAEGVLALPSGLRKIEEGAFSADASLRQVILPEGIASVGREAFSDCENLVSAALPASLEVIDETAFAGCDRLETIYAVKYTPACEWALERGYAVLEAGTGATITPFVDDGLLAGLEGTDEGNQLVLVRYTGGSAAVLSVHEKRYGLWRQLYSEKALVGANGIGKTRDGEKRTPTGLYQLTCAFGILDDPGAKMPYLKVTTHHYWCGTSGSPCYNQLVDDRVTGRACASGDEHLIDYSPYYNYCLFIDYNAEGAANRGSCIFLHCKGSRTSTGGCIAVDQWLMQAILRWIEPGAPILIVDGR